MRFDCAVCGEELTVEFSLSKSVRQFPVYEVEECRSCRRDWDQKLDDARDEGDEEGYDRGFADGKEAAKDE